MKNTPRKIVANRSEEAKATMIEFYMKECFMNFKENTIFVNPVSEEISEVMFNMDFSDTERDENGFMTEDGVDDVHNVAWLIVQMLEAHGAKDIPTVDQIVEDFAQRCERGGEYVV